MVLRLPVPANFELPVRTIKSVELGRHKNVIIASWSPATHVARLHASRKPSAGASNIGHTDGELYRRRQWQLRPDAAACIYGRERGRWIAHAPAWERDERRSGVACAVTFSSSPDRSDGGLF